MTCGNIGTNAAILEEQLPKILLRAANWGALLLIDDADVFLQQRDTEFLEHNALVSNFLQHLDRSDALVFLAISYEVKHDPGLESRMHCMLHLPGLNFHEQKNIWLNLIESIGLGRGDLYCLRGFIDNKEPDGLEQLAGGAHSNMNGRQIQHCLRAALALARRASGTQDGEGSEVISLKTSHIRTVLDLGRDFREQMEKQSKSDRAGMIFLGKKHTK